MPAIAKTGTITQITAKEICVKIRQITSCEGCHHKTNCAVNHCQEKVLTLPLPTDFKADIGQKVLLKINPKQSSFAILLGFIIPLITLLISLGVSLKIFQQSENFAATTSLIILAFYYGLLFLLKPRLNKTFNIQITKE